MRTRGDVFEDAPGPALPPLDAPVGATGVPGVGVSGADEDEIGREGFFFTVAFPVEILGLELSASVAIEIVALRARPPAAVLRRATAGFPDAAFTLAIVPSLAAFAVDRVARLRVAVTFFFAGNFFTFDFDSDADVDVDLDLDVDLRIGVVFGFGFGFIETRLLANSEVASVW